MMRPDIESRVQARQVPQRISTDHENADDTRWVVPFAAEGHPRVSEVGGKGASLITMTQRGFPVPTGFVLTVAFFQPWLAALQATAEWSRTLESLEHSPDALPDRCRELKAAVARFELDDAHRQALFSALAPIRHNDSQALFAVRSSSPDEDLEAASFAGGYETVLGVREGDLEEAVRRSFASSLDARVFSYKLEHGFPVDQPRIAVIVEQQLASDTAGVAFSLNPLNNCYDEAVINANYGLGESVVSGVVSPDTFVVDKVSRTVIAQETGAKDTAIWLRLDGGTRQEPLAESSNLCLANQQVLAIADLVGQVESVYGKPVDVEWAFAGDTLYLLQARPITAYFPLPDAMRTAPGEQKRLYADLTLTKWGMQHALSVMGTDYLRIVNTAVLRKTVSPDATSELVDELRRTVAGRTYVNLSASMKLQGKKRVAGEFRAMDALSADILDQIDEAEYLPDKLPRSMKGMMLSAVRGNLGIAWKTVQAIRNASKYRLRYREAEQELRRRLQEDTTQDGTIRAFADRTLDSMMDYFDMAVPTIAAAELAKSRIRSLFKNEATEVQSRFPYLERALPNNVTIEMGLAMLRLARFDEISEYTDGNIFAARLRQRTLSDDLLAAWDAFMDTYGFRSPNEMDPAAPRYYDRPAELFRQLRTLAANTDPKHNPESIYRKAQDERRTAYAQMRAVARHRGKRTARSLEKWYAVLLELGGYRESPKYFFVLITDMLRRRVVAAAQDLVAAGRLDNVQQVFDLTIDELDQGLKEPTLDLSARAASNAQMMRPYRSVRQFPRLVDSRGKILRLPQREAHEGELAGQPISPGIVRGKTKVLHQADEKPVLPGEILVARATDPGWTPLFINASGIVLEVGGMLQHGALVAREYGKPCVAGVENATTVLSDGQQVELNGHDGTVRLL